MIKQAAKFWHKREKDFEKLILFTEVEVIRLHLSRDFFKVKQEVENAK